MTTLPAFATIEDLAQRRPGGVLDGDRTRAQAALVDVSNLIRAETGKDWVTDDNPPVLASDVPTIFLTVTCRAAMRAFDNPDGVQSEALAPGYSVTLANASSDVYLTRNERAMVRTAAGLGGVFAAAITRGPIETGSVTCIDGVTYLPVEPQPGEPIPWLVPD